MPITVPTLETLSSTDMLLFAIILAVVLLLISPLMAGIPRVLKA